MYPFAPNYRQSTADSRMVMAFYREVKHWEVEDLTDDMDMQRDGVDFRLQGHLVEFKECNRIHQTGNLVFELVSNSRKATPGNCLTSKASSLCYFDTVQSIAYLINFPQLRTAIEVSSRTRWDAYKVTTSVRNQIAYATFGLLVPLSFLTEAGVWHRKDIIALFRRTYAPASQQGLGL